jgi:serine/threonine protein phosphatase PrpC
MNTEPNPHDTAEYPSPPTVASGPADPPSVTVEIAARSHTGLVRANNEDVYLVVRYGRFWQTLLTNLPSGIAPDREGVEDYAFLVADGVGGHAAGEVASRLAVGTLVRLALDTPDWILLPHDRDWERIEDRARERYRQIDAALRAESQANPELAGMGTTMTLVRNIGRDLIVVHVGDSRAYLASGEEFGQLTHDHTLAQELADKGGIAPGDVVKHVFRHVLTRALGGKLDWVGVDVRRVGLTDGDQVLLCSDGLTDMVDATTIAGVLRAAPTPDNACQTLIELALKNGGKDNVTVVLARYRITAAA